MEKSPNAPTIFFAGGGTGGHLFPALAIAERIGVLCPEARCEFLCSERPIDAQILSVAGASFRPIPARPFGMRPMTLARFVWNWGSAVRAARGAISEKRAGNACSSAVVVAMGGFVAAPAAQAARAERVPLALVNLDAVPGKANRWIARRAMCRVTAAAGRCPESWERIAPIVRSSAIVQDSPGASRLQLGLDPTAPTLLVTGGSQGAGSINGLMTALLKQTPEMFRGWQVIHQTGAGSDAELESAYRNAGVGALVRPFFDSMGLAWRAADLAVTRCGAGAVAEAWANKTPALFLPYPYHRDEHQRWNAQPLADVGGAIIERDLVAPEANVKSAGVALARLMVDRPGLRAMSAAIQTLGPADGADRAAQRILGLLA